MILPRKLLLEGIRVLEPFFAPRGFHFQFRGQGKGSGGEYAWGEYTRHDRRLQLHFRSTLGLVSYHISDLGASHETYMRQLGVWEQCHFPGFSQSPLLSFANLTHDLSFAEDFLSGSGDVLRMAAVNEEEVAKERSDNLMATPVGDTQKIKQLRDDIHTQSLKDADQEKEKIHEKYQAERDELKSLATNMGSLQTPGQSAEDEKAKALSLQNEATEKYAIDFKKQQEEEQAAAAAAAQSIVYSAKIAAEENSNLEAELRLSAAQQGKTREQIYKEEYTKRTQLLTSQLIEGVIDEEEYTEAVRTETTKRLEAENREAKEAQRNRDEKLRTAREEIAQRAQAILSDPEKGPAQKASGLSGLLAENGALLLQNALNSTAAKTDEERNSLQKEHNALVSQQTQLMRQQHQIAPTITEGMRTALGQLKNDWGSLALQIKGSFMEIYQTMITSVSSG